MQKLKYTPFEKIKISRPVDRFSYIAGIVENKKVLDLGCLDETAYHLKKSNKLWMHKTIAESAKSVYGIDNSEILDKGSIKPFNNSMIVKCDVYNLNSLLSNKKNVDVIFAGELIEHLDNPLLFLKNIRNEKKFKNKILVLTTPNASSLYNHIMGLVGRESCHKDHLAVLSYKTINTLCQRAKFSNWEINTSYTKFTEMIFKSHGAAKIAIMLVEWLFNRVEYFFPLLAGNLIVKIKI